MIDGVAESSTRVGTIGPIGPIRPRSHVQLTGRSAEVVALEQEIDRVARSDAKVLITGESGVGKEIVARAIHSRGPRAGHVFAPVNCAGLPETLLESELFGHMKGSFTGAARDYKGLFQAAEGGTVFLDEIGDMPVPLQVKLLRVLQEKEIRAIGSTQTIPVNVRIVSATHRNLEEEIAGGKGKILTYTTPEKDPRFVVSAMIRGSKNTLECEAEYRMSAPRPEVVDACKSIREP